MKVEIHRIPSEGLLVEDVLDPHELDLNTDEILFVSPLKVIAHLYRIRNVVSAEIEIKSFFHTSCSRCLREIELPLEQKLKLNYEVSNKQESIDLDNDIRENIILNYPIKFLCKSDCKGLCPKCGRDLNKDSCNCIF